MEAEVVAGVITIGLIHGVLPDHGWPIAATYALNRSRPQLYGVLAGLVLGIGHLVSSVALVGAYYGFSSFADFAEGPWLRYVAGTILIGLGLHEYFVGGHHGSGDGHSHEYGNSHAHGNAHEHDHTHVPGTAHGPSPGHEAIHNGGHTRAHSDDRLESTETGFLTRLRRFFTRSGGHQHLSAEHAERGLLALGTTALLLGFAHEEPIQILAICVGTNACLELMLIYSLAVIAAILAPTVVLIAGYQRHRDVVEDYTEYLPLLTAVVLVGMGLAFITGLI